MALLGKFDNSELCHLQNKRLPTETGTGALPKLEGKNIIIVQLTNIQNLAKIIQVLAIFLFAEFVAKFMGMYRKSSTNFV